MIDDATRLIPAPTPPKSHHLFSRNHQDGALGCSIHSTPRLRIVSALRQLPMIRGTVFTLSAAA